MLKVVKTKKLQKSLKLLADRTGLEPAQYLIEKESLRFLLDFLLD